MKKNAGFTIIEISFVLMILAIGIVAAVKGGAIMDSYKLQSTVTDLQKYKASITQFKQNFNFWPGDLPDATKIWTGVSNIVDGNGDGLIDTAVSASTSEEFQAWYQFFVSGYSPFKASGLSGAVASISFNPLNVAPAKFNASIYRMYGTNDVNGSSGVRLNFIEAVSGGGANFNNGLLKPSDAEILDKKIDDASASTGFMRVENAPNDSGGTAVGTNYTCLNGTNFRVTYNNKANTIIGCKMRYLLLDKQL